MSFLNDSGPSLDDANTSDAWLRNWKTPTSGAIEVIVRAARRIHSFDDGFEVSDLMIRSRHFAGRMANDAREVWPG